MKNIYLKKSVFTMAIVVMFIGLDAILSTGIIVSNNFAIPILNSGNTLYVGGTGSENYTKIQEAIWNASDGDTIYVYDDSSPYYERLSIYKKINLIGEDRNTTIIDGEHKRDIVIKISADDCLISGFTIRNCKGPGNGFENSVLEIRYSSNVIINDNIITMGNIEYNNWISAVELFNSTLCKIQNNIIMEYDYCRRSIGVLIFEGSSSNTVSGNEISTYTIGIGIWNLTSVNEYNNILKNHIHHNLFGIDIKDDAYNKISNNKIEYNENCAIDINFYSCHNELYENIISNNGVGFKWNCGIMISTFSNNNYISNNVISKNNPTGIYMLTGVDNVVTKNNIIDNWGNSSTPERWCGNVFFNYELHQWRFLKLNCWKRNYWSGHSGILPKAIHGDLEIFGLIYLPRIEFDRRPAFKPYDIDTINGCDII